MHVFFRFFSFSNCLCYQVHQCICLSTHRGPSWPWSNNSWIYNYLCNQWLSPLMLWVRFSIRARCTILCDKVFQWLATSRLFSPGPPVSSTNKTDVHDITEILLKLALNTIKQTRKHQCADIVKFEYFKVVALKKSMNTIRQ
jgi:hypothetical protein